MKPPPPEQERCCPDGMHEEKKNTNIDETTSTFHVPQPDASVSSPYRYVPYDQLDRLFFPSLLEEAPSLPDDTLVWVCQSKGRRRRGSQKKELFLRARTAREAVTVGKSDEEQHDKTRICVRYPRGSTYHVKWTHLVPVLETQQGLVVVAPETNIYRRLAVVHTLEHEVFCEVGCDAGATVHRVWKSSAQDDTATRRVWGLDKCPLSLQQARQRHPDLQDCFVEWDILELESSLPLILQEISPNVVALDIGGNRPSAAVCASLDALFRLWQPRLVIVKSRELYRQVSSVCCDNG